MTEEDLVSDFSFAGTKTFRPKTLEVHGLEDSDWVVAFSPGVRSSRSWNSTKWPASSLLDAL